jgi:Ca2+-binding EF-hand superfamily protein
MRSVSVLAPLAAAVALAAGGLAGPSYAQPVDEPKIRAAFVTADQNGDGYVNVDEYVAYIIYAVGTYDKNGDHYLTPDELPYSEPARFKSADRNGDGKLSLGESVAIKMIDYFDVDTNHDGALSIDEILVFERMRAAQR